jgi:predicted DNA-binding protein
MFPSRTNPRPYRLEVKMPPGLKERLERVRSNLSEAMGTSVSMSGLVTEIVTQYLDKMG